MDTISSEAQPSTHTSTNFLKVFIPILLIIILSIIYLLIRYFYPNTQTKSATQTSFCNDTKIVFFNGGDPGDSFATIVNNGAVAAAKELGATVEYVWSGWDSDKMVLQFKESIAKNPDGICIMGHPGSAVLSPFIDEAERNSIIVTSQNVDLPDLRSKYVSNGFGYVGQDVYNSGFLVSDGLVRTHNFQPGVEAIVFGVDPIKDPPRYKRTQGCIDGLKKSGLVVHEVTIPLEVQQDSTSITARDMFSQALTKYPNSKVIIVDHGGVTSSVATHLEKIGKSPGEYAVGGFDLSPGTVAGIENGYISLVQDQQPFLQGYLPILQVCLTKKYGFSGLNINTGVGLIDSSNVKFIKNLATQGIR